MFLVVHLSLLWIVSLTSYLSSRTQCPSMCLSISVSPSHRLTVSSSPLLIVSRSHRLTVSPSHRLPSHRHPFLSFHGLTVSSAPVSPSHRLTVTSSNSFTVSLSPRLAVSLSHCVFVPRVAYPFPTAPSVHLLILLHIGLSVSIIAFAEQFVSSSAL